MSRNILIYTGKIKSGKTTNLFRWLASQKNVAGILQPVVDGKRFIYSIVDKTIVQLEISDEQSKLLNEKDIIKIGNYKFLKSGFGKAKEYLLRDFQNNFDYLIIDEIGPLELNNAGLEPAITKILLEKENFNGKILCVVRDKILNDFIKHYRLENSFEFFRLDI